MRTRYRRTARLLAVPLAVLALCLMASAGSAPDALADWASSSSGADGSLHTGPGGVSNCAFGSVSPDMYDGYAGVDCSNREAFFLNTGYPCSGCQDVRLFWGSWYGGASRCIGLGEYWVTGGWDMSATMAYAGSINFNTGGSGYGQNVFYNTASMVWGC